MKYYDDYVGTVDIFSLSNNLETSNADKSSGNLKDTPDYGLRCWKAYPITIGQVEFSSSNANTLGTIDIGFSFRYTTNIDRMGSDEPFDYEQSSSRKTSSLDDSPPNNVKPSTFKSDSVNGVPTTVSIDAGDMSGARTSGQKTPAPTRIGEPVVNQGGIAQRRPDGMGGGPLQSGELKTPTPGSYPNMEPATTSGVPPRPTAPAPTMLFPGGGLVPANKSP